MAIEKILSTRIQLKIDTLENWQKSTLPLKKGELAIATVAATAGTGLTEPVCMLKVGEDGVKTFSQLEWNIYAKASDVLSACKSEDALKAFVNGVIADAGIATDEALTTLAGRVTTAEGEIDALQADLNTENTGLKARMTAAEGEIDALQGLVGDTKVADQISAAIAALNLANTYDAKGAAAQALADAKSYTDGKDTAMNTRVEALEAIDHEHANKAELDLIASGDKAKWDAMEQNAKDYADDLDEAMDTRVQALEAKFGDGEGNVESQIAAAVAAEKERAEGVEADLAADIKAISDDYLKASDKTALQEQITANDGEIAALQGLVGDTKVSDAIAAEAKLRGDADTELSNRIKAVEDDYLKAADKEALQNQINTIMNNPDAEGAINSINEFTQYVADHGTIADGFRSDIDKNKEDIAANANAIADEKSRAEGVEGGLDSRLAAVEAKFTDDGAVKSDIAAALAEAKGYTDTEVKELAEGAVATNASDIANLKTQVGDGKVSDQISAITNPIAERVTTLEGKAHEHANKDELDKIVAGDKAKWDAAVQTVTAAADSGLKATKTGTDVAIEIDDSITWVFDCGGSGVTA